MKKGDKNRKRIRKWSRYDKGIGKKGMERGERGYDGRGIRREGLRKKRKINEWNGVKEKKRLNGKRE